jgi:crossover junction endodeoxyribonuclease RuvC
MFMLSSELKEQLILGVDPGTRITGYGIIKSFGMQLSAIDFGCIRPPTSFQMTQKYRIIFEGITLLIERHAPHALAVETQYIHKNPQSGIKLGMARGMILLAAALREIPVFEYAPTRAKQAVTGTGRASKPQVQGMVRQLLMLKNLPEPEDAADALAIAICHAHASKAGWDKEFRI